MLRIFALVTLVAVLSDLTAAAAPTLDGCTFAVELVAEDGGKAEGAGKDTVSFMGGFADCVNASTKYGYAKGTCKTMKGKGKDEVLFRFTMTSAKHGELLFEGTVQGKVISGKRTWSKPNKPTIVHRFTGKLE